jgi:hypothetical protein
MQAVYQADRVQPTIYSDVVGRWRILPLLVDRRAARRGAENTAAGPDPCKDSRTMPGLNATLPHRA